MKNHNLGKNLTVLMMWGVMLVLPVAAIGQTRITMPKNKYKIQDDVKIGQQASAEVERQMPVLNDPEATRYIQMVGERLVNGIPAQFRQPAFDYRFRIVNARDINAFALPGGPMYVNRGMIAAARSEGEMAGVMAHEISHIALRHGTSQATKQSNPLNQIGT
ncbi:MAG: M48 family metalloprotease, partial [Acidobacteriota bacterium]|nr:M48 family metalloprotease [Acidobacteriota bacterium]